MALVPDQKFSTFQDGGDLAVGDLIVGLRDGLNTKFNYTGELPIGFIVPIDQGGTDATTAAQARINLGLGTMAVQDADAVAITGGDAILDNLTANNPSFSPNFINGYTTTATAAGTTILTSASTYQQFFTGVTTQTVKMPDVTTLVLGQSWLIVNNSSGTVTVTSSGGNTIVAMAANTQAVVTCIAITGTTETSWESDYSNSSGSIASIIPVANQTTVGTAGNVATVGTVQDIGTSSVPSFANVNQGYTTTATAAGTTTLVATSNRQQYFTGTLAQTVKMPVTSTLVLGQSWIIVNNSTGSITVQSSGSNTIVTLLPTATTVVTCILTSGTTAASWYAAAPSVKNINIQTFTSSGTFTPTSGMLSCKVEVVGGGGAGGGTTTAAAGTGGAGAGGGAGGYSMGQFLAATIGASQTVTIGAGGTGVAAGSGNSGSATSLGALITANGGSGGGNSASISGTAGLTGAAGATAGSGGSINNAGAPGGFSFIVGNNQVLSGSGGNGFLGGAGNGRNAAASNTGGTAATANSGSGGSGSVIQGITGVNAAGGTGGSGFIIITEYIV